MAKAAKVKPPQTARLLLIVSGIEYRAAKVEPPVGYRRAFMLTRDDAKLGRVGHLIAASAAGATCCDCEAAKFAKDGAKCKHVRAARAVGLI